VRGWLGIQRCLDRNDYGIDILRNGRKIEVGNKDLFKWLDESSDTEEIEYPIDDPRDRGRMVGEIHLDHCRVPYTKDRFVREDAAWREMVEIVRGNTPLRPDIAERMGAGENNSPLYRLFQAFRRSNPHNRRAGGWSRILVVPDNDRAQAMAKRFDAGESEYQTDQKWWELIEDAEANVLQGGTTLTTTTQSLGGYPDGNPGDILGGEPEGGSIPPSTEQNTPRYMAPSPIRTRISSLSRQYTDDLTGQRYEIEALVVGGNDPVLTGLRCPWTIRRTTAGPWEFYVDTSSAAFRSMTLTPLDALLMQLAWFIGDFERGQGSRWTFGAIVTGLREKYATASLLNPQDLVSEALAQLVDIARSIVCRISVEDSRAFFDGLSPSRQESVRVAMASRGVANPRGAIDDGRFLQYASPSIISEFVFSNPMMFFDGNYWDEQYSALDYGSSVATDEARARLLGYYGGLLADAVWLAQQTPVDLADMSRERLMRASLATALLAPTACVGEG
jgi:hypothetical protein